MQPQSNRVMRWQCFKTCLLMLITIASVMASRVATGAEATESSAMELTPSRLSYIEGSVSFWRPGAEDWAPARVNTPLAAGDAVYTGARATVEIQVGPRAFVRAQENTRLGLGNFDPDFMQFSLTAGRASLDLRALPNGVTVELGTPNAIFTIEHPGYYRAEVVGESTHFVSRRGGRSTVTVAGRAPQTLAPSEELIVRGIASPALETYAAPQPDAWDRWNYARTDHEIEAQGARYVSPGVYGIGALDDWGSWRVAPDYGAIWVPDRVAPGWAPYSSGSWMWDVIYGWTWVDDAPWGWAPFHYGRWIFINGRWAWAPGPVIARAIYAPALVAFFGLSHNASVRIGIGLPAIGWVALGWGEPLRPWWGRPGFIGQPWWGGWGGPRVVNHIKIDRTAVVNVNTIIYEHTKTPRAHIAASEQQFGRGPIRVTQFSPVEHGDIEPIHDAHPVRPGPGSLAPAHGNTVRPPAAVSSRPVVATRPPREAPLPWPQAPASQRRGGAPEPHIVAPPQRPQSDVALPRPAFGEKGMERPRPSPSPRFDAPRVMPPAVRQPVPQHPAPPAAGVPSTQRRPVSPVTPRVPPPADVRPPAAHPAPSNIPKGEMRPAPRAAAPSVAAPPPRALPGRPANEMFSRRSEGESRPPLQGKPSTQGKAGGPH